MEAVSDAPWWLQLILAVAGTVGSVLLGQLARLMNKWFDELSKKTNLVFLANVDEVIMGYVSKVYQQEVKALKETSADGKLSEEDKKRLLKIPVDAAKELFSLDQLGKLFGGKENVDAALESRVEKAVVATKAAVGK